jgi:hydrogenase nickel incorporation protein HypA/HybF
MSTAEPGWKEQGPSRRCFLGALWGILNCFGSSGMHEFAICQSIVSAALDELGRLNRPDARLIRTRTVIGDLHQIVADSLLMAYEVLTRDTAAEGSKLDVRRVPVVVRCAACGRTCGIEPPVFGCAFCGSGDVEIIGGKELYLDQIEIEEPDK